MVLEWHDSLAVGHAAIDHDHMYMMGIINRLGEAVAAHRDREIIGIILGEIADYTRVHFEREEDLMRRNGDPDLPGHKREHDQLLDRLAELTLDFERGQSEITHNTMDFLHDWLTLHIMRSDLKLAALPAR